MHKSRAVLRHRMAELLSPKLLLVKNKFCSKKKRETAQKKAGTRGGQKAAKAVDEKQMLMARYQGASCGYQSKNFITIISIITEILKQLIRKGRTFKKELKKN